MLERRQRKYRGRHARRRDPRRLLLLCAVIAAAAVVCAFAARHAAATAGAAGAASADSSAEESVTASVPSAASAASETVTLPTYPKETASTVVISDGISSNYAVLVDVTHNTVVAEKNADQMMYPASMTKLLTLLVACEKNKDLSGTFTMTWDIANECYVGGASVCGFEVGEVVRAEDLLYGTVLPSGADAALCLAEYTSGTEENFVDGMNAACKAMGLTTAHFDNCIGLYADDHCCTVKDIAVITEAVLQNATAKKVLCTEWYTIPATNMHPDGISLSNMFLRRMEERDSGTVRVLGAKTGYVPQSKNCAASYGVGADGTEYVCVTGCGESAWSVVDDHAAIYSTYVK